MKWSEVDVNGVVRCANVYRVLTIICDASQAEQGRVIDALTYALVVVEIWLPFTGRCDWREKRLAYMRNAVIQGLPPVSVRAK